MAADPEKLAYWLLKDVNRALRDYAMIADGERVAVAVSGGKDSLTLLRLLDLRRRTTREPYELIAVHVRADGRGPQTPAYPPLEDWLAQCGLPFTVVDLPMPDDEALPMGCQRCTHHRRRALFEAARREGCGVVAFGHHADDLAQTTLLNLLYNGRAETMAPRRDYFGGQMRVVRPLCYLPENAIRRYARAMNFPPPPPACPQSDHSRRALARSLIEQVGRTCRDGGEMARANLMRAGLRGLGDAAAPAVFRADSPRD